MATETAAPAAANPFAQDVEERLPPPSTIVLFGATGDLAARKLLPAVYDLLADGELPERLRIVAVARDGHDDASFRAHMREAIEQHARHELDLALWEALEPRIGVVAGTFGSEQIYRDLAARLDAGDREDGGPTQRLFYLAVAPTFFADIASDLAKVGLGRGADPPTRLLIEKPFGHDLASARELNARVAEAFDERQVFRIDHYLGKETVQNLLVLRFANGIFEPLWNRTAIDHVQITVAEDLGIGHRAGYYDGAGALRDVIQNHALQLLSLIAMEPPTSFDADLVRDEKAKALRAVRPLDPRADVVRGRYTAGWVGGEQVPGYREEEGVPADSRTETYAALRLEIDSWRWAGVPFYIRTGKRLPLRATEIAIAFKPAPHLAFGGLGGADFAIPPNELVIAVQPDEGASLRFAAKVPGTAMRVRPVQMDFQYGRSFLRESPEAYERLVYDALLGEATLFTRADEVEAAWRIVDPVLAAWAEESVVGGPKPYAAGTAGPAEADRLTARDGNAWRPL
ncbi:MAG TPA: glucose-6-phosphate dehydrogenase [Conexibacter sp.]|nr:glucose-6-phosphate dehydrogenase [Conexibacter sp.]